MFIIYYKMFKVMCCLSGYDLEFFEFFLLFVLFEYGGIFLDFWIFFVIGNCKEKLKLKGCSLVYDVFIYEFGKFKIIKLW